MPVQSDKRGPIANRVVAVGSCLLLLLASVAGIAVALSVLPLAVMFGIGTRVDEDVEPNSFDDADVGGPAARRGRVPTPPNSGYPYPGFGPWAN